MKKALISFDAISVASLRILIATITLMPVFIYNRPTIKREDCLKILAVALFGNGLPAFCFTIAQTKLDSGTTGVLNADMPLSTLITGILLFKVQFNAQKGIGILCGLVGAIVLLIFAQSSTSIGFNHYALLILLAGVFYALSANIVHKYCQSINAIALTTYGFLFIAPFALILALYNLDFTNLTQDPYTRQSLIAIGILGGIGTGVANVFYYFLAQRTSALQAASATYIIPVVALAWASIDNEPVNIIHLIALAFICLGVYSLNPTKTNVSA